MQDNNSATALADSIAKLVEETRHALPQSLHEAVTRAIQDLRASGIERGALGVGNRAPDFDLPDQHGKMVRLSSLLEHGLVVLSFYRGGWCPFCNLELQALQRRLPDIKALGAELVAISPELPDWSSVTAKKNEINFSILSDAGNRYAEECGLMFKLPEAVRSVYEHVSVYGNVLARIMESNGDDTFTLPVPATYVVGADGEIKFAYVNVDHRERCEPQAVVDTLGRLAVGAGS